MQPKLNWQAYSVGDRNESITKIKEIILSNDAYIVNFSLFSDIALSLSIEIPEDKILSLFHTLSSIVEISEFDFDTINQESNKEWLIFLNVSFSRGKGDLKIKVPEIPG